MTIETKYSIGETVYFASFNRIESLYIEEIHVHGSMSSGVLDTYLSYSGTNSIKDTLGINKKNVYIPSDLFSSPELLINTFRQTYENRLNALLATVKTE